MSSVPNWRDLSDDPRYDDRFHVHFVGQGTRFIYQFLDRGETIEAGPASSPSVILILFDEFMRGRVSADQEI